jgi:hypothetical protein
MRQGVNRQFLLWRMLTKFNITKKIFISYDDCGGGFAPLPLDGAGRRLWNGIFCVYLWEISYQQ